MPAWTSNHPLGESVGTFVGDDRGAEIYIFAKNLKKFLKGDLALKYLPMSPTQSINHGALRLQTSDEREFLLRIEYVTRTEFEGLGAELGWHMVDNNTFHSSPRG